MMHTLAVIVVAGVDVVVEGVRVVVVGDVAVVAFLIEVNKGDMQG